MGAVGSASAIVATRASACQEDATKDAENLQQTVAAQAELIQTYKDDDDEEEEDV